LQEFFPLTWYNIVKNRVGEKNQCLGAENQLVKLLITIVKHFMWKYLDND
jgi:hypothetical protein